MSMDCRGVRRGRCLYCGCGVYDGGSVAKKCLGCCHAPGKHENMDVITSKTTATTVPQVSVKQPVTPVPAESSAFLTELPDISDLDLVQETESVGNFESELPRIPSLEQADCVRPKYRKHNYYGRTRAKASRHLKASTEELCNTPGCTKPKYNKGDGTTFDYCSIYCRDNKQKDGQIVCLREDLGTCDLPDCVEIKYQDPSNGRVHNFCSRSHAEQAKLEDLKASTEELCNTPGCTKPKYNKGDGMTFDYCSIYCRDNEQKDGQIVCLREDLGTCDLPDCVEIKYQDRSNGRIHDFCSRSHAEQAKLEGISNPKSNSSISLVDLAAENGIKISKTFNDKWDPRKGKCPAICFIFSVKNTFLKQTWRTYKKTLQDPSLELHFHGTLLKCNITAQGSLCTNSDCGICNIVTTGFDRRCIRKNINFQRFGHGFYVAPNSSKCHDYTQGMHGFRAMILLEVCPGKKYERSTDDETLKEPPSGFNSVYGISGKSLNYDELVLYNPDCALPKYIIVYQHNGVHKIAQ